MTTYLARKLLDHTLGKTAFAFPAGAWLSLHTADPTKAGSHASEVTGGGYARVNISPLMTTTNNSGVSANGSEILIGPATADWGTVTHVMINDAPAGGNGLLFKAASIAVTVNAGNGWQLAAAQLPITFE